MSTWTRRAKLVWAIVVGGGGAALMAVVLTGVQRASRTVDGHLDWTVLAALCACSIVFALRPIRMAPDRLLSAASAPLVALALVYDPAIAVLAAALAKVTTQAAGRVRWYVGAFNVSQRILAVGTAGITCIALQRMADLPTIVPCIAGGGMYFLVNTSAVAGMSAARKRRSWLGTWSGIVREQWLGEVTIIVGGVLLAVHVDSAPIAIPLLAVPLWLGWRVLRDAAEIKRLNATLGDTLDAQRRFVANASHELRTPVASLRAQIDVLRARPADLTGSNVASARFAVELDHMAREAARMSVLLADLLALAHADGGAPLASESISLEEVLFDVYREALPLANDVELRVTLDEHAPHPPVLLGDRERLRQLFLNLVTNALRFTPERGSVEMRCTATSGAVEVAVIDNGTGIEPEALPRIFERFYRADRGRARQAALGGSGLGLSIAKWIAEAHGGSIRVDSQPGKGSTFTVRLPAEPLAPASAAPRTGVRAASAVAR
jgi:signal transduction histidine kinase